MSTEIERDMPECESYNLTPKFAFGDKVFTPYGEKGTIVELDGKEFKVVGEVYLGWFPAHELIHAE